MRSRNREQQATALQLGDHFTGRSLRLPIIKVGSSEQPMARSRGVHVHERLDERILGMTGFLVSITCIEAKNRFYVLHPGHALPVKRNFAREHRA